MKFLLGMLCLMSFHSFGQQRINLHEELENKNIKVVNRMISIFGDNKDAVEMNAEKSDGLGVLEAIKFTNGIIEVDLLGENNPGKSFIGIAFNIQNDSTYEAIYCRPFNFVAKEQLNRTHMVQYISHPVFTWRKLRDERTGEFENVIAAPPNPDAWFRIKIKIDDKKVAVYINEIAQPVLTVDRLTTTQSNKIGIWTGFGSSGRFRNLVIKTK